jgi:hypothetical protein
MLDRQVDVGRSVTVNEHHQAVMAHADWIIDLGAGASHDGGRIVLGEYLAAYAGDPGLGVGRVRVGLRRLRRTRGLVTCSSSRADTHVRESNARRNRSVSTRPSLATLR